MQSPEVTLLSTGFSPKGKWNITADNSHMQSPEALKSMVVSTMDYSSMDDTAAAKFIKVVGLQKSGSDIANECAMANVTPDNLYGRVENGNIILRKANTYSFCKDGLKIAGEISPVETDVVILATGYKGDQS
ncbi:hypothetical protein IFM89_030927 [Coptis chinensis]|uniref:Flavin-containing monooxygenase n=1 Tax=Coptis chinensis TaxID=261450 RepID=A0A835LX77_9MAGN|nr:hypothetical protein IFM89_030927 [Coptis chinensis]